MRKVFAILFVMLLLQGCVVPPRAPFRPATGAIYTNIQAPLKINHHNAKYSDENGEASTVHVAIYFFSFAFGDASLKQAMKDGLLQKADYVDYEWTSILGMFGRLTVRAYGQGLTNQTQRQRWR